MKLCTFEIRTHLGRRQRLGAVVPAGILDLNFAFAACLAAEGDPRAQKVADVLVPDNMLEFLQAGSKAQSHAARSIEFAAAGAARGPNDETLIYALADVRLLAPLPNPASVRDFYAFEAHVKKGFEKRG